MHLELRLLLQSERHLLLYRDPSKYLPVLGEDGGTRVQLFPLKNEFHPEKSLGGARDLQGAFEKEIPYE